MPEVLIILYVLMAFMVIGSIIAIETSDLLSAVIAVGAVGFALSVIDLLLGAPDLALTQVVVEVLILVFLLRVVVTRRDETHETHKDTFAVGSVLLLLGALLVCCFYAFHYMHPFGQPLMTMSRPYLEQSIKGTGAVNAVMAVLLDFRAYDTLGEATVIFASIIGALVILRKVGRKRRE